MNVLKKLENAQPSKPYRGFAKLNEGNYEILNFRVVKNKFGKKADGSNKSILVELAEEVLFLPQYFWQKLNAEDIRELNDGIQTNEKVYLHYGGKSSENG